MTEYDGTDTFTGNNVTGSKLDTTVMWHGSTLPTSSNNQVPANGLFLNTNSGEIYENTGTLSSPTWVSSSSSITINPDTLVMSYSQTIGDFTNPSTATSSSNGTDSGWKYILDSANYSQINDNNSATYYDRKTGGTSWATVFTWTENNISYVQSVNIQWQGMKQWTPSGSVRLQYSTDNSTWTTATSKGISGYGSWNNWGTESVTINANARYWRVQVISGQYGYDAEVRVHKLNVYGDVASDPNDSFDDDDSTLWKSGSESNPNIYYDVGSAKLISHIAIKPNAETTSTELKLQSSTDASTWSDLRTITYSNLTEGSWNYLRFNVFYGQYFRVYGNDGTAKVLAITEIKYLTHSDSELTRQHGHIEISSSDTGLSLDGT
jgi:hypothetical protein